MLINGECLEEMAKLESGSFDLILTDPPYGTTACKWDSVIPFEPMWEQLKRLIKPNGAIVLFGSQPFTSALIMSNPKMFKYCWIWEKPQGTGHLNAKKQPMRNAEDIAVFYKKQCLYYPQFKKGEPYKPKAGKNHTEKTSMSECYGDYTNKREYNHGFRYPKQIISFGVIQRGIHPTQKPVDLLKYLIKTYTNENEHVLDFTMGSGSTGVACANLNRRFTGIELDSDYFKIAQDRIANATNQAQP